MAVVFSKYANRLAPSISPRGMSRSEAAERADANVMTLRDAGVARIDHCLEALLRDVNALAQQPDVLCHSIYDNANTIGGTAAVFGYPALGSVAYGLCDLIDNLDDCSAVMLDAVKIHSHTMKIFRQMEVLDENLVKSTLADLTKMRARVLGKSRTFKS